MEPNDAFQLRRSFTVPKHDDGSANEDHSARNRSRGRYALSDGASVSFDSATWSRLLVHRYVVRPDINTIWLRDLIGQFAARFNWDALSWSAQAAFERGSFASLLGIRYRHRQRRLEVQAIGDSLGVLCDGNTVLNTFPYTDPDQFDARPNLISTNARQNRFDADGYLLWDCTHDFDLQAYSRPHLLCMTDALGRWFLTARSGGPAPVSALLSFDTQESFAVFVQAERAQGRLRRDDTTLLLFW